MSRAEVPADGALLCWAPDGLGEVEAGADLAALLLAALTSDPARPLADGDVVVVTSKVVSKAEGRARQALPGDAEDVRAAVVEEETRRLVARRGRTRIARTRHGLVLAAAGVDASNTPAGTVLPLPVDPDASARRLRERLAAATGLNLAVVVTDTAGRAWRTGQTDQAIGAAGLEVLAGYAGRRDGHGNVLMVTEPAVADEVAGTADLVKGKLSGRPVAVLRGLGHRVLPPDEHGPGAAALVRPEPDDLFGLGAREAVLRAVAGDPADLAGFGRAADAVELVDHLTAVVGPAAAPVADRVVVPLPADDPHRQGLVEARATAVAFACGWRPTGDRPDPAEPVLLLAPALP